MELSIADSDILVEKPLRDYVKQALERYFVRLEGHPISDLYKFVLEEVEIPLLEVVMVHAYYNQCKAARLLGISRGTLLKKLNVLGFRKKT